MNRTKRRLRCFSNVFPIQSATDVLALFVRFSWNMTDQHAAGARSVLISEAAAVLGISRRTVYYRIGEGRLQTIRTRGGSQRVLWSSIEAYLRACQNASVADDRADQQPEP